ncbi:MAG: hypothetical protein J5774_06300 [Clostridia bacterium]|nr:hypothetical protein [Clostridia bacterium]
MKSTMKKSVLFVAIVIALSLAMLLLSVSAVALAWTKVDYAYSRQGDTVWLGEYPQTLATDKELSKMSSSPDENGYYTSGKDKFVKVTTPILKNAYHNGKTDYLPFSDDSQPDPAKSYYFKVEPIQWRVLVDDEENDAVMLVSDQLIDAHVWLSSFEKSATRSSWAAYDNTLDGVPAETPANGWRYSEMRAFLNGEFYNTAFNEKEKSAILLFANKNTIDYRENDESTVVNDYVAIGNAADYAKAGDRVTPTDYAIVKGMHWQIDKNNCAYFVNEYASLFPEEDIRGYISSDHGQVLSVNETHGVRAVLYAKRSVASVILTVEQKEDVTAKVIKIVGIVAAVVGALLAIPVMVLTRVKYNKQKKEKGTEYKLSKKEVALLVPGLLLLIAGIVLIVLEVGIFGGGLSGIGGAKVQPGIYVQSHEQEQQGNAVQVGKSAYRLNADGTYNYAAVYDGASTVWDAGGTWSQSGSTLSLKGKPNPMYPNGYTVTATVYDGGKSFGNSTQRFKKIN